MLEKYGMTQTNREIADSARFFSSLLKQEIEEHIEDIARDTEVPVSRVREEWLKFESQLNFFEPDSLSDKRLNCIDPDDLPYIEVCEQLGAQAVYTRDAHFQRMGVPSITVDLDLTMRDYARARSIQVTANVGSGLTVMFSLRMFVAIVKGIVEGFKRLPIGIELALGLAAFVTLMHPESREKIANIFRSVCRQLNEAKSPLLEGLAELGRQYTAAEKTATDALVEIQAHVPPSRRRSALTRARAICLVSKEPLSVADIECRMRMEGYISKSQHFRIYLRQLLRRDKRFL